MSFKTKKFNNNGGGKERTKLEKQFHHNSINKE